MTLRDRVAVVTGAAQGLGQGLARRFAAEGAHVVLSDLAADQLDAVAEDVGGIAVAADVSTEAGVRAVADLAVATHGRVDVWVSNAGRSGPGAPGELLEDEVWQSMWQLHVMSHVYAARAVVPAMIDRGDGYLLQVASEAAIGLQVNKAAYTVTKHASRALGEWLAVHLRPKGVRVSCVCPGAMLTPMLLRNGYAPNHPKMRSAITVEHAADVVVRGMEDERFMIMTDPHAADDLQHRHDDWDGWLEGLSPWT